MDKHPLLFVQETGNGRHNPRMKTLIRMHVMDDVVNRKGNLPRTGPPRRRRSRQRPANSKDVKQKIM